MGVRIDQLLHWLCLAKSRSLVARACRAGRIRVNGQPVRPAKEVGPGDRVLIEDPLGDRCREFELLELPAAQASRKAAPGYYRLLRDSRHGLGEGDGEGS